MTITLGYLSGNPTIFKKIINSDDFIKKIFTVTSSLKKSPLDTNNQLKPTRTCSTESIDSAYESDLEETNNIKCLSTGEFYEKVNQLKIKLYGKYSSTFLSEQSTDSLIKENRVILDQYKELPKKNAEYADFLYRDIRIPGINNKSLQEKKEIIKKFALPKPLTNKNGSMLPLKKQFIQESIRHITLPYVGVKYKTESKFNKKLVYIHYKTCEENRPNQRITSLPKTTFEFKGNIPQTKSSLLRAQRIKEHYNLSSKITTQKTSLSKDNLVKNKILVNSSDLLKIIEKEYQLTQEMNNHIKIIAEIDAQMKTNSQLLALYKSPIIK